MLGFRSKIKKGNKERNKNKDNRNNKNLKSFQIRLLGDLGDLDDMWLNCVKYPNYPSQDVIHLDIVPNDGIWKKFVHRFQIEVGDEYPIKPPKVRCLTRIWHPNIDKEGAVCLNILREDWKPVLTLNEVFFGLYFLFNQPNPDDPLNHEAAGMMVKDYPQFLRKAKQYMKDYAILNLD